MKKITDKMRMDWLQNRPKESGAILHKSRHGFIAWQGDTCINPGRGITLRKAIDAAIRKERSKKK